MKKSIILYLAFFLILVSPIQIAAKSEHQTNLLPYQQIIDEVNREYNSDLYILEEEEFLETSLASNYNSNYDAYLASICNTSFSDFRLNCLDLAKQSTFVYEFTLENNSRSTVTSKTVSFYNGRNTAKLTYAYSSGKFDTSYNNSLVVQKVNPLNYFKMTSYRGEYLNSNTTYSVVLDGIVYSSNIAAGNKKFIIDFNI